jgi:hypothetical protein
VLQSTLAVLARAKWDKQGSKDIINQKIKGLIKITNPALTFNG